MESNPTVTCTLTPDNEWTWHVDNGRGLSAVGWSYSLIGAARKAQRELRRIAGIYKDGSST